MESVKINTTPKGARSICYASQYDNGRIVRFELFSELLPYKLDGSETIKIKVVRPDNVEIIEAVTNTEDYYIDVNISSDMTALAGVASCELEIKKGDTVIGSRNFDMNIESDSYGSDISIREAQGIIATFETDIIDNLVSLKTTFEPKQDLHGYNTPWIDSNVVNKAPYLSRALAGTASRIGNYEFNKLVGGTYAFNQYANKNYNTKSESGITITNNGDGSYTLNGTASSTVMFPLNTVYLYKDHIYLAKGNKGGSYSTYYLGVAGIAIDTGSGGLWKSTLTANSNVRIDIRSGSVIDNVTITPQIFDLTQLFGSTIADYIYSLEKAQAGAGVSFFKALFDKDYYPYNAGELISVKPTAHITKDGNNTVISNTALDPDLELRGIPKLDENNNLYYDGDIYESNGDVTRKFIKLVFNGSENWQIYEGDGINQLYVYIDNIKTSAQGITTICAKYRPISINDRAGNYNTCYTGAGSVNFNVEGYTVDTWKAFLTNNNIEIVCELATPTTESADPFTDPQEIDAQGSEEFIDARAVSIPVGHESYYANICEINGIDEITFYHSGEDTQDPESALVEIGQTVYGGYYDKDLGIVLTSKLVDLGSLTWNRTTSYSNPVFYANINDKKLGNNAFIDTLFGFAGNFNNSQAFSVSDNGTLGNGTANEQIYARLDEITDKDTFKSFVTGVKLCYELADPIIIPADAVNFETVKGVNNVWSDTNGETEVKFFVKEA